MVMVFDSLCVAKAKTHSGASGHHRSIPPQLSEYSGACKTVTLYCIAVCIQKQVYMVPLREASETPEPILDTQEISTLFGPVEGIISCHELFYLALSSKASEWAEGNTIGDCVLSSVSC